MAHRAIRKGSIQNYFGLASSLELRTVLAQAFAYVKGWCNLPIMKIVIDYMGQDPSPELIKKMELYKEAAENKLDPLSDMIKNSEGMLILKSDGTYLLLTNVLSVTVLVRLRLSFNTSFLK